VNTPNNLLTSHKLLTTVLEQMEAMVNMINTQLDNSEREKLARNQHPAFGFGLSGLR
jgi:hypothetical protein